MSSCVRLSYNGFATELRTIGTQSEEEVATEAELRSVGTQTEKEVATEAELRSVGTQTEEEVGKRSKRARKDSGRRRNKDAARAAAVTAIDSLPQGRRLQLEHTFIQVSP